MTGRYNSPMPATVLIIDDDEGVAWGLREACKRQGHRAVVCATAEAGLAAAATTPPDAVFLDIRLPGMDGLTALGEFRKVAPDAAVIVITAHGNLSTAVRAVAGGAFDYLAKPFDLEQAVDAVNRAVTRTSPVPPPAERGEPDEIIGGGAAIQTVFKLIALVAPTNACVLITGESGTGKELVARAVHAHSDRRAKAFLPIHVAALNPNLVESELFGHVKGAFTGADRTRPGLIALADGGTVFLDELGDIPLAVQAKLLRVLERQEVLSVGGIEAQKVNVRIVSATNADLAEAVAAGRFREDLYFRLNVYPIHLPALRDRTDDIPRLAEHFLRTFAPGTAGPLPPETVAALKSRAWPGNVRELKNAMEYAAIVARGGPIGPEHLPEPTAVGGGLGAAAKLAAAVRDWTREQVRLFGELEPSDLHPKLLAEVEPALLTDVLERLSGNRLVAGRWLGLARATVRKLIRKYHLEPDAEDSDDEI